jgi:hypothetical protein
MSAHFFISGFVAGVARGPLLTEPGPGDRPGTAVLPAAASADTG